MFLFAVLSASALSGVSGVGLVPTLVSEAAVSADVEMVQEGDAGSDRLIAPRRLPNPCLESPQRMDLHRELLFNQRMLVHTYFIKRNILGSFLESRLRHASL